MVDDGGGTTNDGCCDAVRQRRRGGRQDRDHRPGALRLQRSRQRTPRTQRRGRPSIDRQQRGRHGDRQHGRADAAVIDPVARRSPRTTAPRSRPSLPRPRSTRRSPAASRHRQLGALAHGRGRHRPRPQRRASRHVEPRLLRQPGQGDGHARVHLLAPRTAAACTRNSGVPNHAYALLVDGGTYNGQTISGIGLTKAAHIYFRAMSVYQGPASDFADHADALEQSCSDLIGIEPGRLTTGAPSGEVHLARPTARRWPRPPSRSSCGRRPPVQLPAAAGPEPAGACATRAASPTQLFHDTFDNGKSSTARWSVSHSGTTPDFTPRDWAGRLRSAGRSCGQCLLWLRPRHRHLRARRRRDGRASPRTARRSPSRRP